MPDGLEESNIPPDDFGEEPQPTKKDSPLEKEVKLLISQCKAAEQRFRQLGAGRNLEELYQEDRIQLELIDEKDMTADVFLREVDVASLPSITIEDRPVTHIGVEHASPKPGEAYHMLIISSFQEEPYHNLAYAFRLNEDGTAIRARDEEVMQSGSDTLKNKISGSRDINADDIRIAGVAIMALNMRINQVQAKSDNSPPQSSKPTQ